MRTNSSPKMPQQPHKILPQGLKSGRRTVHRYFVGAADEFKRLWLREDEAKAIILNGQKITQAGYEPKHNLWHDDLGYYRLFEHIDGTRGLFFSFHQQNLELTEVPDERFPNGIRHALKSTKDVFPATKWMPGEIVKLGHILMAMHQYSDTIGRGIANETLLYVTDREKGLERSGAMAFRYEFVEGQPPDTPKHKRLVKEVYMYSTPFQNGQLVNPYGDNITERVASSFDPGVGLFGLLARQKLHNHMPPTLWESFKEHVTRNGKNNIEIRPMLLGKAQAIVYRAFLDGALRYIDKQDPLNKSDKQWNKTHYFIKRTAQIGGAIVLGGAGRFKNFMIYKGPAATSAGSSLLQIGKYFAIGGSVLGILNIPFFLYNMWRLVTTKVSGEKLLDTHDAFLAKISEEPKLIEPFNTFQRKLKAEALGDINFVQKPTFDPVPPYYAIRIVNGNGKTGTNDESWVGQMIAYLRPRGRSRIDFYHDKETKPCAKPGLCVAAHKIRRTDGVVAVRFHDQDGPERVWGLYLGASCDYRAPQPYLDMRRHFKRDYVIEIIHAPDPSPPTYRYIPLEEAERYFMDRFGEPLLEKDLKIVREEAWNNWMPEQLEAPTAAPETAPGAQPASATVSGTTAEPTSGSALTAFIPRPNSPGNDTRHLRAIRPSVLPSERRYRRLQMKAGLR